jgi:hypothetical protein
MLRRNRELWYALAAMAATTAAYLLVYQRAGSLPPAFQLFGHGIGILGFILMLMTETLYSIRKLSTKARWGSMAGWLRFHMFTGLVGSYMVLLHPAMSFRGLAGVLTLMTLIVVVSGLVGRYIYTAVPRAVDASTLEARRALATWRTIHVPLTMLLFVAAFTHIVGAIYYATLLR